MKIALFLVLYFLSVSSSQHSEFDLGTGDSNSCEYWKQITNEDRETITKALRSKSSNFEMGYSCILEYLAGVYLKSVDEFNRIKERFRPSTDVGSYWIVNSHMTLEELVKTAADHWPWKDKAEEFGCGLKNLTKGGSHYEHLACVFA